MFTHDVTILLDVNEFIWFWSFIYTHTHPFHFILINNNASFFFCTGTHWTHEILAMLISRSSKYNTFGTLENMVEAMPNNEMLNNKPSPRLLLTHLPYKYLPSQLKNGTGKIVYVQRNPKDLHVSMYNHQKGKGMMSDDMTWAEFFDMFVVGESKYD